MIDFYILVTFLLWCLTNTIGKHLLKFLKRNITVAIYVEFIKYELYIIIVHRGGNNLHQLSELLFIKCSLVILIKILKNLPQIQPISPNNLLKVLHNVASIILDITKIVLVKKRLKFLKT